MACQQLTKELWAALHSKKKTFLLDCDGVLWHGNVAIQGAPEAVARLKQLGKRVILVTNNSGRNRASYVEKCNSLGIKDISEADVVTTSAVLADYMQNVVKFSTNKRVYVVGSAGISSELSNVGISSFGVGPDRMDTYQDNTEILIGTPFGTPIDQVGAVVVGYDPHISFPKALKAATYLKNPDCLYVATNDDETYPTSNPDMICPGTGSIVAIVTTASGRTPVTLGKPYEPMFKYILQKYGLRADETIMVGDRLRTDIQFAKLNGLSSLLVLTGQSSLEEVDMERSIHETYIPDFFCNSIGDLASL